MKPGKLNATWHTDHRSSLIYWLAVPKNGDKKTVDVSMCANAKPVSTVRINAYQGVFNIGTQL